jgi:hypothetical protein
MAKSAAPAPLATPIFIDMRHVVLHRLGGNAKKNSDFSVGLAARDPLQHLFTS